MTVDQTAPRPPSPDEPSLPRAPEPAAPAPDAVETFVPYKNVPALAAYYLGVFSLVPVLGFFLTIPAIVLGIMGLNRANANPRARGKVHAWVGVILAGVSLLAHTAVVVLLIMAAVR